MNFARTCPGVGVRATDYRISLVSITNHCDCKASNLDLEQQRLRFFFCDLWEIMAGGGNDFQFGCSDWGLVCTEIGFSNLAARNVKKAESSFYLSSSHSDSLSLSVSLRLSLFLSGWVWVGFSNALRLRERLCVCMHMHTHTCMRMHTQAQNPAF
jgi:hypothetical protein